MKRKAGDQRLGLADEQLEEAESGRGPLWLCRSRAGLTQSWTDLPREDCVFSRRVTHCLLSGERDRHGALMYTDRIL